MLAFLHDKFLLAQARNSCRLRHILSLWETLSVELSKMTWLSRQVRLGLYIIISGDGRKTFPNGGWGGGGGVLQFFKDTELNFPVQNTFR